MNRISKAILGVFVVVLMGGCAEQAVMIPLDALTETAGEAVIPIADASTAKELGLQKTWRKYQTEYTKAYKDSGFSMTYAMVDIGGVQAYLPTNISFKAEPKMVAPPTVPSQHPVWNTINTGIRTIAPWAFGYMAADSLFGSFEAMSANAGNHYAGPVQMSGSYNTAGNDQSVSTIGPFQQDQGHREQSPGCSNGDCGSADSETNPSLLDCRENPPGGFRDGVPMYNDHLSCGSFFTGT